MKKILILALILCALSACLAACGEEAPAAEDDRLQIVATIFPGYDFARQVCGENAEITMLLPPGAESHSYEPTPQDIITMQNCDLFIYVGGESDAWVETVLASMDQPLRTLKMMDYVNVVEEEVKEGMEPEHDHEDSAEEAHSQEETTEAEDPEHEYDEHVWTAPANAVKIVQAIADAVAEIDSDQAAVYSANAATYTDQLNELDQQFAAFFATVENKTLIIGDRFPLRYFTDAYSLDYYAAFPGCSTETEPSAATIAFLINKVKAENISTVFYIEFSNHLVADSIAEATGTNTALFHTCHNISPEDLAAGVTYLSLMQQNLATLQEAMH